MIANFSIPNFLIFLAAIGLGLAAFDVLLGEQNKASFLDWLTRAWNYLDNLKRKISWRNTAVQEIFIMLLVVVITLSFFYFLTIDNIQGIRLLIVLWGYWGGRVSDAELEQYMLSYSHFGIIATCILIAPFVVPMLAVLVAQTVLWIVELFVRRITEYPKGPVIALSLLLAALAALVKQLHQ
jgi:hypothetical protein